VTTGYHKGGLVIDLTILKELFTTRSLWVDGHPTGSHHKVIWCEVVVHIQQEAAHTMVHGSVSNRSQVPSQFQVQSDMKLNCSNWF
jgi:hypothetical protein